MMEFLFSLIIVILGFLIYRLGGTQHRALIPFGLFMVLAGLLYMAFSLLHGIDLI